MYYTDCLAGKDIFRQDLPHQTAVIEGPSGRRYEYLTQQGKEVRGQVRRISLVLGNRLFFLYLYFNQKAHQPSEFSVCIILQFGLTQRMGSEECVHC